MKLNLGNADRILRVVGALLIAGLFFTDLISGTAAIILGILAVTLTLTSALGFCPLYVPFRFSTRRIEKKA